MDDQSLKPKETEQSVKEDGSSKKTWSFGSHFILYIGLIFFFAFIVIVFLVYYDNNSPTIYDDTIDLRTKKNNLSNPTKENIPEDNKPVINEDIETSKESLETLIKKIRKSIVFIEITMPNGISKQGSGFFISNNGHILTCHHIIDGGKNINVIYSTETEESRNSYARVIWTQEKRDISLIQIIGIDDSIPMKLGKAENITQGHPVAAIGYPLASTLGIEPTVTTGIISSIRKINDLDWLQISAPVNPGNSGGALVSIESGEAIGVVSAKIGRAEGIGFATPINSQLRSFLNIVF